MVQLNNLIQGIQTFYLLCIKVWDYCALSIDNIHEYLC